MQDCKLQILKSIPNNTCCSQAFLNAVIFSSSQIDRKKNTILISSEDEVLDKISKIVSNFYQNIELNRWENFLLIKGNIYSLLNDINYENIIDFKYFPNACDQQTILKTIFITNGKFYYTQDSSKNSTGYQFEIVLKNENLADNIISIFEKFGFELKKTKRMSNFVIYTKNSDIISDIFVFMNASYTALEIQNSLAMREMRNSANRQSNCFGFNLNKTISASGTQLEAINFIFDNYSIDYLDESLREVALARIANPDVSLKDLQTILNNKLTRAGIKYRLDKIIEISNKLKGENKWSLLFIFMYTQNIRSLMVRQELKNL